MREAYSVLAEPLFIECGDGVIIHGDVVDERVLAAVVDRVGQVPLVVADPPYGRIASASWDRVDDLARFVEWMHTWTLLWKRALLPGAAFYVWGGVGKPGFRPFFEYISSVERRSGLMMPTLITWKKKRAYGTSWNYLMTREELAYLVNGDPKKPRRFNVPYLDKKRGYAGYDKDHPAKSEYLRRTAVWFDDGHTDVQWLEDVWDVTEVLRGKLHECQKADRVCEIPIEVHTEPGEVVVELFGGSGSTAAAARRLGRRFVVVEKGAAEVRLICKRLGVEPPVLAEVAA